MVHFLCIFVFEEATGFWVEEEEEEGEEEGEENLEFVSKLFFLLDLVAFRATDSSRELFWIFGFFFWVKFEIWVRCTSEYVVVARCGIW